MSARNVSGRKSLKRRPSSLTLETTEPTTEERHQALKNARNKIEFFAEHDVATILSDLKVDASQGLSSEDARKRLEDHGPNKLTEEKPNTFWQLLAQQFMDTTVIALIVAAIVSAFLSQVASCILIACILIANATLGVVQESRAESALRALDASAEPRSSVLRDGKEIEIESSEVVPGDIIILANGAQISADIRLIVTQQMSVNEMPLTGESEPVQKSSGNYAIRERGESKAEDGDVPEKSLTDPNMCYRGCTVLDGRGTGVVLHTGMDTKLGKIQDLIISADDDQTPLEKKLDSLAKQLLLASVAASALVFIVGAAADRGYDRSPDAVNKYLQLTLTAVALTVAAVPEGLPVCVTISLAVGMQKMSKKHALIRKLKCVETLGCASVICSDKTGTLTKGEMTAVRLHIAGKPLRITGTGFEPIGHIIPLDVKHNDKEAEKAAAEKLKGGVHEQLLSTAVLCSIAKIRNDKEKGWICQGPATEKPLVVAAVKAGLDPEQIHREFPQIHENPFNSTRKMMSTLVDATNADKNIFGGKPYASCVKGAPNMVIAKCTGYVDCEDLMGDCKVSEMTEEARASLMQVVDDFSDQAFRVLAIAYRPFEKKPDTGPETLEDNLVLCGLVASIDPERNEVAPSIKRAAEAGIRTVMITGDYVKTAKAIAENIGLLPQGSPDAKAVDCQVIRDLAKETEAVECKLDGADKETTKNLKEQMSKIDERLDAITAYADVYARAQPVDKITIVRSLQRQDNVCSMTGDGVNDAPALKQANIGVAMGSGTDVARNASDMILTNDNFVSIVTAIELGRTVYSNISKFCYFLLSTNVAEVFVILISTIMGLASPLDPVQILWLNLTTDGMPAVALAIEKAEPGIMEEGPRPIHESVIEKVMVTGIIIQTILLTGLTLGVYCWGLVYATGSVDGMWATGGFGDAVVLTKEQTQQPLSQARTMTIYFIVFAELLRAYGARSLRRSIFQIGVLSNMSMQIAVAASIIGTLFVGCIPVVQDKLFGMVYLDETQWSVVLGLAVIPLIVDEVTKAVYRYTGFGERPKASRIGGTSPKSKQDYMELTTV